MYPFLEIFVPVFLGLCSSSSLIFLSLAFRYSFPQEVAKLGDNDPFFRTFFLSMALS